MSGETNTGAVSLTHDGTALGQYLRVTWSGTALALAGATDREAGTLEDPVLSGALVASVLPMGIAPRRKFIASQAIAKGAAVYPGASGKVTDVQAGTTDLIGWATEAVSGDGSVVDVLHHNSRIMS